MFIERVKKKLIQSWKKKHCVVIKSRAKITECWTLEPILKSDLVQNQNGFVYIWDKEAIVFPKFFVYFPLSNLIKLRTTVSFFPIGIHGPRPLSFVFYLPHIIKLKQWLSVLFTITLLVVYSKPQFMSSLMLLLTFCFSWIHP